MFDRAKFEVSIGIERVTRVPFAAGSLFVRWRVTDSPRPDAHGRTPSKPIHRNEVKIDFHTKFKQRIRLRTPSKQLGSCTCHFEVIWEPLGGKGVEIGELDLDIAQFARLPNQTDEDLEYSGRRVVSGKSIPFLLKGARTNCLMVLNIDLHYHSGNNDYEVPDFDLPAMSSAAEPDEKDVPAVGSQKSSRHDRDKLRHLREEVLQDLMDDPTLHQNLKWHDMDTLLKGEDQRLIRVDSERFAEQGVRDPRTTWDITEHKDGTPFLETEIRDNFVTWNAFGTTMPHTYS